MPVWVSALSSVEARPPWVGSLSAASILAMPKSSTLMTPDSVIMMFSGLRSRWTRPSSCA